MNCVKKYCGKCLCFNSEESKNHIGHKIIDYSEIKNSNFNDIINEFEIATEKARKINDSAKTYEKYMFQNKITFETANYSFKQFKDMIFKKMEEKNNSISFNIKNLNNIKEEIINNSKLIYSNMQKLENVEKPIQNFNIEKNIKMLRDKMEKVKELEKQIENKQDNYKEIEFKTINFSIEKSYKEIVNNNKKAIIIKKPIYIEIQLKNESYISIITLGKFNESKKKTIYLFPIVFFKNKLP